jgi:hypothetical protein
MENKYNETDADFGKSYSDTKITAQAFLSRPLTQEELNRIIWSCLIKMNGGLTLQQASKAISDLENATKSAEVDKVPARIP